MEQLFERILVLEACGAIATHLWLKRSEPSSLLLMCSVLALVPFLPFLVFSPSLASPISGMFLSYLVYSVTLATSVVAYRISSFHPLSKHPGPLMCKITKLWSVWVALKGDTHLYHKRLHDKYGPTVRIGPNELSTVDKDLIPFVLGSQGMPKGQLWDGRRFTPLKNGNEYNSLVDVRDLQIHAQLRKAWNKAFAPSSMRDYEEILVPRVAQLGDHLAHACRNGSDHIVHVDLAKWISFFSFDFMGDIAFGGCFELMRDGDEEGMWKNMESGLYLPSIVQHVPWIAVALRSLPFFGSGMQGLTQFGVFHAKRRAAMELKKKDLFYYLLEASNTSSTSVEEQFPIIVGNAILTIVAGSDTTASVMSSIICYLLCHPDVYKRLRDELDHAFPYVDADGVPVIETEKLSSLNLLNAVINETLRLLPAVPTSLQRAPARGSGGKMLGTSFFIPEGTGIQVPPYVLHRDPRYFSPDPDGFNPDRWLAPSKDGKDSQVPEFLTTRDAFIPFSYGPANCAGKSLALTEMRAVIALLLKRFDLGFESKGNLKVERARWEGQMKDRFVFAKGKLPIWLKERRL